MKKLATFLVLFVGVVLFAACSKTDTPSKAMKYYFSALQSQDYDTYVNGMYFGEDCTESQEKEAKAQMKSLCQDKLEKANEKKGGMKDMEILSEEIDEAGDKATVKFRITYGDGSTDDSKQAMAKVDGDWKMYVNK